jgi:type I restriction enzyme, R subunit
MPKSDPEYIHVEAPLLAQLHSMGWTCIEGDEHDPAKTGRARFTEVLLRDRLREAIRRINVDEDGTEWLDEARIAQALSAIERVTAPRLMEANELATELIRQGTVVEGVEGRDGGREQVVHFIDFEHPERNDFLAINQYRVDRPGAHGYSLPDVVLFVNGIPLVVIECKSPYITDPIGDGVEDLLKYSNQRDWVTEPEGAERLFQYNQLLIASSFDRAIMGTVGARGEHYVPWKDPYPLTMQELAGLLNTDEPSSQQILAAGILHPERLLDLVRHFVLFTTIGGRRVKIAARYQQYRAVNKAIERLTTGKSRREDGEHDRRGGIIWHTQGSGKSLTMVFLVRKMRSLSALRRFKVVVVTDRRDLEQQLSETATLSGESVLRARKVKQVKKYLKRDAPDLVFAMIQKYQETEEQSPARMYRLSGETTGLAAEKTRIFRLRTGRKRTDDEPETFPELNDSGDILVVVDEAHRSHASGLHANLMQALPNCAKIGFTGTPIIMGEKKRTHEIFGPFIDTYRIEEAEADGVTVPIYYEGRTADSSLTDGKTLDTLFEDLFSDRTEDELEEIRRKYATKGHILDAQKLIEAKAEDMLRHYISKILPEGFKAQVIGFSRAAAVRYRDALEVSCRRLIERLESIEPRLLEAPIDTLSEEEQYLVRAQRHLPTLRRLEFAAVISGDKKDPADWERWSDPATTKTHIERFKKALVSDDPSKEDGLAFLCVRTMLLTGFDAPVEQVLYIDRPIREHELLQAIARVNRTAPGKEAGYVVDYVGIAENLKEALAAYSADDIKGALTSLKDELPRLRDRRDRVVSIFHSRGVESIDDVEGCVGLLKDVRVRAEFLVRMKEFLDSLNRVLPRPEALPFVADARRLGKIQIRARNEFRDEQLDLRFAQHKVRQLIDEHLIAHGIDSKIPPTPLLSSDFEKELRRHTSRQTQASEMEHALRHHISKHRNEDPIYYRKLSERVESILQQFKDSWEMQLKLFEEVREELKTGRHAEDGIDPIVLPFRDMLGERRDGAVDGAVELNEMATELVDVVRQEVRAVGFWRSTHMQERLRGLIVDFLDQRDVVPFDRLEKTADDLLILAKENHDRLL